MKDERRTIKIDPDIHQKLKVYAAKTGGRVNYIAEYAILKTIGEVGKKSQSKSKRKS